MAETRLFREGNDEPAPPEHACDDDFALRGNSVKLRRILGKIEPNPPDSGKFPAAPL